jgi:hypothetical protein
MHTWESIRSHAYAFAQRWQNAKNEKSEAQMFVRDFLTIFGINDAAEKMAKLHDALKETGYDGHNLEIYLVRLLFCLFAGDTGIFQKSELYNYIVDSKEDGSDLSHWISDLFDVLNMSDESRAKKIAVQ